MLRHASAFFTCFSIHYLKERTYIFFYVSSKKQLRYITGPIHSGKRHEVAYFPLQIGLTNCAYNLQNAMKQTKKMKLVCLISYLSSPGYDVKLLPLGFIFLFIYYAIKIHGPRFAPWCLRSYVCVCSATRGPGLIG